MHICMLELEIGAMEQEGNGVTKIGSTTKEGEAPHFVLIHGACHGAWCWYKLRSLLESVGYRVTCIDLAGSGIEPSDANFIFTFKEYNKPLLDFMESLPVHEKVIVVGHSAGGQSVTQVIHLYPHKIKAAVYLAAIMLRYGIDDKLPQPDFSKHAIYYYGLGDDQPPTSLLFKEEYLGELFYNMSPSEDISLARTLLRPSPVRALADGDFKKYGEGDDWKMVPRVYIKTSDDHMCNTLMQDFMILAWPPSQVSKIRSDHSAFFSNPSALFALLVQVVTSYSV